MLRRDEEIELDVERPAAGGAMIARASGAIVLVEGAIPGERVRARITRVTRGVAHASTVTVLTASPDRRTPTCDIRCAGSLYAHIAYPRQLATKAAVVADAFTRIARAPLQSPVVVRPSPEDGYRMRARLHLKNGAVGFYREGTHALCGMRETRQLRPDTCDAIERSIALLRGQWGSWDGELAISENIEADQRAIHLFLPAPLLAQMRIPAAVAKVAALISNCGVTGLSASISAPAPRRGGRSPEMRPASPAIDGEDELTGTGHLVETLAGQAYVTDAFSVSGHTLTLRRHVLGFFQGNRFLLAPLAQYVIDQMDAGGPVVDLYAGCGLFSIAAAVARGVPMTAVEGGRVSAGDLAENVGRCHAAVTVVHQPVERFVSSRGPAPRTVIVDPPRTGLSSEAAKGIIQLAPARVVYVSCDVATLARDARKLLDAGYRISGAEAFDLFPNTPHVESVVTFDR